MPEAWIARWPLERFASAAALRTHRSLEASTDQRYGYLRGRAAERDTLREQAPAAEWFTVDAERLLTPLDARLPSQTLPPLRWRPIAEQFPIRLPDAEPLVASPVAAAVTLVPAEEPRPVAGLLTDPAALVAVAAATLDVRLTCCRFVRHGDRALVVGDPLPPAPGTPLCEDDGVLVPAGSRLAPPLGAGSLRDLVAAADDDTLLVGPDGVDVIPKSRWVTLSRRAIHAEATPPDAAQPIE